MYLAEVLPRVEFSANLRLALSILSRTLNSSLVEIPSHASIVGALQRMSRSQGSRGTNRLIRVSKASTMARCSGENEAIGYQATDHKGMIHPGGRRIQIRPCQQCLPMISRSVLPAPTPSSHCLGISALPSSFRSRAFPFLDVKLRLHYLRHL